MRRSSGLTDDHNNYIMHNPLRIQEKVGSGDNAAVPRCLGDEEHYDTKGNTT